MPQWKNETNTALKFDDLDNSWFASVFWIVGFFCSPIGGALSGWLGRRKLILFGIPFVICGWLIIGFAQNKVMIFVGRIIQSGKALEM